MTGVEHDTGAAAGRNGVVPTTPPGPARPRRADALRNVEALLAAARTVLASSGVGAPAKEITDLAGVGVGTLYRHFPRRSDLVVAVLQHELDECVAAAQELAGTCGPWEAVAAWSERYADFVGTKRGLAAALHTGDPAYGGLPQRLLDRLEPALHLLLARAVDAGDARDDVTARDVLTAVALLCHPVPGEATDFNRRMVTLFVEGLRRPAASEPPGKASARP